MPAGDYERGDLLGEGTYGEVFRAVRVSDDLRVAVKRIRPEKIVRTKEEGLNITALREIKHLRELRHRNIIQLLDVYLVESSLHLVFEYCVTDLEGVLQRRDLFFSPSDIKAMFIMILRAVGHCHSHFVLHRDLKPANLLIGSDGEIKLTDFGLARCHGSPNRNMTANVVTTWYRAPELLFGANFYSGAVDLWAAGLIFLELFLRTPLLQGKSDIEQLSLIFHVFGTPNESNWPGVKSLPNYIQFEERPSPLDFSTLFRTQGDDALDLFLKIMKLDPRKRLTADNALLHPYVTQGCVPTPPADLPMMRDEPNIKKPKIS